MPLDPLIMSLFTLVPEIWSDLHISVMAAQFNMVPGSHFEWVKGLIGSSKYVIIILQYHVTF